MAGDIKSRQTKHGIVYWVRVELPPGPDGERRQTTITDKSYKGLERQQRGLLHQIDCGQYSVVPVKMTLGAFLDEYLRHIKGINPGTYGNYVTSFKAFRRLLGNEIILANLTTGMVQEAVDILKETLKDGTVCGYLCLLNQGLQYACRSGIHYLNANPVDDVIWPKNDDSTEKQVWEDDTANVFIRSLRTSIWRYAVLFLLLLKTGLRIGEALALRWTDLDLDVGDGDDDEGFIHITKTVRKDGSIGPPKTKRSVRKVPIEQPTVKMLRRHRARQAKEKLCHGEGYNPDNLVFTTKKGKCPWPGPIHKSFQRACTAFGVPYITVHGLRHTHATMLLENGYSVISVAERLGDKPATIIKYYGHRTPGKQKEILRTIERIYEIYE